MVWDDPPLWEDGALKAVRVGHVAGLDGFEVLYLDEQGGEVLLVATQPG